MRFICIYKTLAPSGLNILTFQSGMKMRQNDTYVSQSPTIRVLSWLAYILDLLTPNTKRLLFVMISNVPVPLKINAQEDNETSKVHLLLFRLQDLNTVLTRTL